MENCPVCGEPVKVVGGETKHYESVAKQQIDALKAHIDRLNNFLKSQAESISKYPYELHENCQKMMRMSKVSPEQSLAEHDRETAHRIADFVEFNIHEESLSNELTMIADAIRQLYKGE